VVVIGDATLDLTVRAREPIRPGGDAPANISLGAGGQGANVAVRLARRGVRSRLVAPVADDAAAGLLRDLLDREGPLLELAALAAPRTAMVLALLDPAGERTMLSDRVTLPVEGLLSRLDGAAWIHCSGYPLADDATGEEVARALGSVPDGIRVSIGGGSLAPDPALAARVTARISSARPSLVVFSLDEARALLGDAAVDPAGAAAVLGRSVAIAIVTAGPGGSWASHPGGLLEVVPAGAAQESRDATGAGDAYLAALLALLLAGPWPPDEGALRQAMRRAGKVGAQVAAAAGAQAHVADEVATP